MNSSLFDLNYSEKRKVIVRKRKKKTFFMWLEVKLLYSYIGRADFVCFFFQEKVLNFDHAQI